MPTPVETTKNSLSDALEPQSFLSFLFSPRNPRGLWVRYVIAFIMIVLAVCVSHFAPYAAMNEVRDKAATLNVSGKQRMLSQRILFLSSHISQNSHSRPIYAAELKTTINQFERGHMALLKGNDLGILQPLPPELEPLYFKEINGMSLDARVQRFIAEARQISESPDPNTISKQLQSLIASGLYLQLTQLDDAVIGFQTYTQRKVDRIRRLAFIGFLVALAILLFEAFFVFLPAHRSIIRAMDDADNYAFKLEQNNADLNHFAYVASHDLRAPLRGMSNLVTWVKEDLPQTVSNDTRSYLDLLDTRIVRMEALLTDILNFSRAGKAPDEAVHIDIDSLIEEVKSWITIPEGFSVETSGPMPTLYAPYTTLQQCFLNLISNGIKHHDKNAGTVKIKYKEESDYHIFRIEDDGPGIPDEYHAYVFEMFNRLKSRDDVEGSGIGLAIIKRMMETIGGSIQVDPKPQQGVRGTAFILSVPKVIKA